MENKIGKRIKEIRLRSGLSQNEFGKSLGYTSRSSISKIEKGINEISYEKLILLFKKYDLYTKRLFDEKDVNISEASSKNSILYISFSGKSNGNCNDIINYLMKEKDSYIAFKDILFHPCSNCEYECFHGKCKYRNDDIYKLIDASFTYKNIVLLVPMYCSNPSSLYFTFLERMQDYFNDNDDKWNDFVNKLKIVAIFGSEKETPLFIPTLLRLIDGDSNKILKIERHIYNLKMTDKVIENKDLIKKIDAFFRS